MKTITKRESIYAVVVITLIMILLTSTDALASYNSYMSPHVNVVKKSDGTWQNINVAVVKGIINVYTLQVAHLIIVIHLYTYFTIINLHWEQVTMSIKTVLVI